jgi:hypothetical protein
MQLQGHALLVDLFRVAPSLALDLLRATGVNVTAASTHILESTFPVPSPDYYVDLAISCDTADGAPSLVVLVEVQLDVDAKKVQSWPLYQAAARARFKCDACVLVVAIEERVAAWASTPIVLGPGGSVFRAVVLGPATVPHLDADATPELALLAALAHGAHEPDTMVLAVASIAQLEEKRSKAYFDLLRYHLGEALERALEAIMATSEHKYLSDFARKYYDDGVSKGEAKGKAEGKAEGEAVHARTALLTVVTARDISLDDDQRATIGACADVATLDTWLARAARATSASEIFAD